MSNHCHSLIRTWSTHPPHDPQGEGRGLHGYLDCCSWSLINWPPSSVDCDHTTQTLLWFHGGGGGELLLLLTYSQITTLRDTPQRHSCKYLAV